MKRRALGEDDRGFLTSKRRPSYEAGHDPIRIIDLFSGCGGMTLGLAEAARAQGRGLDVRLAVELEPKIHEIYRANFEPRIGLEASDACDVLGRYGARKSPRVSELCRSVGRVDLVVGGPPCQGHSNLNNHTRRKDPKNGLYLQMVRAAFLFRPTHLVIENVPMVLRAEESVVETAVERLEALGYNVAQAIVPVAKLGIPQLRRRHVLVASTAFRPDLDAMTQAFDREQRDLRWAIGDLDRGVGKTLFTKPSLLSPENLERAQWLLTNKEFDLPNRLRPRCHRDKPMHRYKSMYGRLDWSLPAHTITSGFLSPGQGRYLHPSRARTLTPHEAARLQFFPDWFDFSSAKERRLLAEAIGNAVPPKLTFAIASYLLNGENFVQQRSRAAAG